MRSWLLVLVLLTLPAWALEPYPSTGAGGPTDLRAYVRFVHLAPGVTPMAVLLDNSPLLRSLTYGQATGYQAVQGRRYTLALWPLVNPPAVEPMAQAPVRLTPQCYYTFAVLGAPGQVRIAPLYDDPGLPPRGQVRVRFLNATVNAPPLSLATPDRVLFPNVAGGQATAYQLLPTEMRYFAVMQPGSATPLVTIPAPPARLGVYTVVLYGNPRGNQPLLVMLLGERER